MTEDITTNTTVNTTTEDTDVRSQVFRPQTVGPESANEVGEVVITARGLGRIYHVQRKAEGITASLRALIRPTWDDIVAVQNLDMTIRSGELIGFLGPNGAGKTTTLKMLSGLIVPTCGELSVLGVTPFTRQNEFLRKISLVMGQKQNLWWDLPPLETFALHREIYSIAPDEYQKRLDELVTMLEISDCLDIQVRKLSLGQRMRCELAVALLHRPQVLFLDEPTIGLDILMQRKVRAFLLDYHARFRPTILLTSHYMGDVAALCRRVIVINRGRKIFDGVLPDLTAHSRQDRILTVTMARIPDNFSPWQYGDLLECDGLRLRLRVERSQTAAMAARLYDLGVVDDLTVEEPPLEEVMAPLFATAALDTDVDVIESAAGMADANNAVASRQRNGTADPSTKRA